MITTRRLFHLLTLVEHGHFGNASKVLNISQPALSKSIQALEDELGVQLLDRGRGAVTLTAYGEVVLARSRMLLTAEDDLRREIALLAGHETGAMKVALGPYPSVISGYPAIARLFAKHPKLNISVHVSSWRDVAHKVRSREVDLGIAEISSLDDDDELITEPVGRHRGHMFCRAGHPLLASGPVSLAQTLAFPWVGTRLPARVAAHFPEPIGVAGTIDPANGDFVPAIEIDVPMQITELLANSDALALATLKMLDPDIIARRVAILPLNTLPIQANYGFIYLKGRSLAPAALAYMDAIRAVEAEIIEREAALLEHYLPGGIPNG